MFAKKDKKEKVVTSESEIGLDAGLRNQILQDQVADEDAKNDYPEVDEPYAEDIHEPIEFGEELKNELDEESSDDEETTDDEESSDDDDEETSDDDSEDSDDDEGKEKKKIESDEETPDDEEQPSSEDNVISMESLDDVEITVTTEDGEEKPLKAILEDWKNNENWKKANTERDQKVAEDRRALETDKADFEAETVKMQELIKQLSSEQLLEIIDYNIDGDNPVRQLIETVEKGQKASATRAEEAEKTTAEEQVKIQEMLDEQVKAIQADDSEYERMPVLHELYNFATELQVPLPVAYDLKKAEKTQANLETIKAEHKKEIDEVNKNLEKTQKELKERNKEVEKLKKNPKRKEPSDERLDAEGVDREVDNSPPKGWEDTTRKIREKLEIKEPT